LDFVGFARRGSMLPKTDEILAKQMFSGAVFAMKPNME
jgi:hypothetical protein